MYKICPVTVKMIKLAFHNEMFDLQTGIQTFFGSFFMHQPNNKARTNKKQSVNNLHFQTKLLVLSGVYIKMLSCSRGNFSCARHNPPPQKKTTKSLISEALLLSPCLCSWRHQKIVDARSRLQVQNYISTLGGGGQIPNFARITVKFIFRIQVRSW